MSDPLSETPAPVPVEKAVAQLRSVVLGLGAALLVVTLMMTGLVWYQTRQLSGVYRARKAQLEQLQGQVQKLGVVANELAVLSNGRPDWLAIFRAHGIEVKAPPIAPPVPR
jgi:hypothetical protein